MLSFLLVLIMTVMAGVELRRDTRRVTYMNECLIKLVELAKRDQVFQLEIIEFYEKMARDLTEPSVRGRSCALPLRSCGGTEEIH